jgi:toxin ParE1/3/4
MEIEKKEIIRSVFLLLDAQDIYEYGAVTFGEKLADIFYLDFMSEVNKLETHYLVHPECRHLITKTKKYRNIIFRFVFNYLSNHRQTS